ncbi:MULTISPECIES: hypothetical protein [Marivita]|uniref:Uncharacterized protein n=1 Tax=Marivita cryptomonadis TaxID=505252 RepID=A0A9Q2RZ85_9RHOB|nr:MULTISPECIES: hypothetical protein [Marivita]MCR9168732.1 hypothetical protein [Paracoccaceae bacterium]MBM2321021.1 hypothetical protein [Marivita cryptomonadis]MBM2330602.1 hypothetical protein [Marivita cryptomonadis]MBM2340188.1 hypothetical protein [Marivita cryptomonadis]MBM2344850.1 hypothetical protein [Marivita cryptomonadis]
MRREASLSPKQLGRHIKLLEPDTPKHKALEQVLHEGVGYGDAWYSSQKEHWLGWLREYSGPGAYGRKTGHSRDARYVYNHIQCAPMLFWLAEALDIPEVTLDQAFVAVTSAPARNASQCAAFRNVVPWEAIESTIGLRPPPCGLTELLQRLRVKSA